MSWWRECGTWASEEPVREVILATNPNYEGDYTAAYIEPLITAARSQR